MRAHARLNIMQDRFAHRLRRLSVLASANASLTNKAASYIAIEALNAWTSFAREYYVSCSVYRARGLNGALSGPTTPFPDERTAMLHAIQTLRPLALARARTNPGIDRRNEPTWHEIRAILTLSNNLVFSNNPHIQSALAYPTTFFRDMPAVRNFFAHRNKDTAAKVINVARNQYGLTSVDEPHAFLSALLPGRPTTLLQDWLDDLTLIGHAMCY